MFNEGRENAHDEARRGHPSLVNDDLMRKFNERVRDERLPQFLICLCIFLKFQGPYSMTMTVDIWVAGDRFL